MTLRTGRPLYLNPEKARALYGQMFGKVPLMSLTHSEVGGRAIITANLGAEAGVGGSASSETRSEISADALAAQILEKLGKTRDFIPNSNPKRLVERMLKSRASAIATIEGRFFIDRTVSLEEWFNALAVPGYVTLFLDETDRRIVRLKEFNRDSPGIWLGMNTEFITESKHPAGHLGQVLMADRSVYLSATGWVEANGYINPLVVYR